MKRLSALVITFVLVAAGAAFALADPLGKVQSFAQTATTSAAALAPASWARLMKSCVVQNVGTTPVYLGGSDVTSANGYPVCSDTAACATAVQPMDVLGGEVFIRTSSGTQEVRVLCGG